MLTLLVGNITQRENEKWMGRIHCHKLYLHPSLFHHGQHFSLNTFYYTTRSVVPKVGCSTSLGGGGG
jgi:hypothetical protein